MLAEPLDDEFHADDISFPGAGIDCFLHQNGEVGFVYGSGEFFEGYLGEGYSVPFVEEPPIVYGLIVNLIVLLPPFPGCFGRLGG